jgi:hypothetical protein
MAPWKPPLLSRYSTVKVEAEERQYQEEFQNGYDDRFIYVGYDPKVNSKAPHYIEGWRRADADCREGVAKKRG